MYRPTLEEQIKISKLTDDECIKLLLPQTPLEKIDFWIFRRFEFLWHILHWNWFDPFKDLEQLREDSVIPKS